jgi:hypothetical protein
MHAGYFCSMRLNVQWPVCRQLMPGAGSSVRSVLRGEAASLHDAIDSLRAVQELVSAAKRTPNPRKTAAVT